MDAQHPTPLCGTDAAHDLTAVIVGILIESAPRTAPRPAPVICPHCEDPIRPHLEAVSAIDTELVLRTFGPDHWCIQCWWDHGPDGWEQNVEVAA